MEIDTNSQYIRGFNYGYLLAQTMPELADKIAALDVHHRGIDGIRDGNTLYKLEQIRDRHFDKELQQAEIATEQAGMNHDDAWIKSYNHGDLLARRIPELIPTLLSAHSPSASPEIEGMQLGIRHVVLDMAHERKPRMLDDRTGGQEEKPQERDGQLKSRFVDWPKGKDKDPDIDR